MCLGFALHALNLFFAQAARTGNGDFLLLTRSEILGRNMENAVHVDVKGDLDLRHSARSWWETIELERAELLVVAAHAALSLQRHNLDTRLILRVRGENLRLASWDRRIAWNHRGGDTTGRFDCQRQRRDIQKQNVLHVTAQHAALNRSAHGDHLIWVHALVRFLADDVARGLNDLGHAGHPAHENEFVDVFLRELGIRQTGADGLHRALKKIVGQLL